MKSYKYFIIHDPYDPIDTFFVIDQNCTTSWNRTIKEAIKENEIKESYFPWTLPHRQQSLTKKEVLEGIPSEENWKIYYMGDALPTIETHPEFFL